MRCKHNKYDLIKGKWICDESSNIYGVDDPCYPAAMCFRQSCADSELDNLVKAAEDILYAYISGDIELDHIIALAAAVGDYHFENGKYTTH